MTAYQKYEQLKTSRGLTDYRVGVETGISRTTLSEWKAGRYTPKVDKLKKLADYFDVSVEYFLKEETEEL